MRTHRAHRLAALALLAVAGCAAQAVADNAAGTAPPELADTCWIVESLADDASPDLGALTLDFVGSDRISGFDGCNSLGGSVTINGSTIAIGERMLGTMVACAPDIEKRAQVFRSLLIKAARVRSGSRDRLELADANGRTLAVLSAASGQIAGTRWSGISYNNGRHAVTSVILGTRITATFGGDGARDGQRGMQQLLCVVYRVGHVHPDRCATWGNASRVRRTRRSDGAGRQVSQGADRGRAVPAERWTAGIARRG